MNLKAFVESLTDKEKTELMGLLSVNNQINNPDPEPAEEDFINKNNPEFTMNQEISNKARRSTVRAGTNTWSDEGEDRHIETPSVNLTPRNRKPPAKKDVVCNGCGKKETIQSSLVYGEYYRCGRCVGK